jgi:cation-transporting ATPase E
VTIEASTSPRHCGLTSAEAARLTASGQVNRAPGSGWADYREILLRNTVTFFNVLVVTAAVALFVLGDYRGAWAVSAYALINAIIGLVQEIRAKRHLDRLALLVEGRIRVIRDGVEVQIRSGDIVLGDRVVLNAGDVVPADGVVAQSNYMEIDESLLTGESDPVRRHEGERVLSGSVCVAGAGGYDVDRVGRDAYAHQVAAQARKYRFAPSPMQRVLNTLLQVLMAVTIGMCCLYVILYFVRGFSAADLWQMIAATVTSMVPQGLILMTTVAFTISAVRMSMRGAVVQRLSAIESMAAVNVLCMDKTGTLTTNQLKLDRVVPVDATAEEAARLLTLFAWSIVDGSNKAISAIRSAHEPVRNSKELQILGQIPFKSQNRYSAIHVRDGDRERFMALGAIESLQPRIASGLVAKCESIWKEQMPTGARLLLFVEAEPPLSAHTPTSLEGLTLRPLAVIGLGDALRPEAASILMALADEGIDVKILSGDNPETVRATVSHLPLKLVTGPVIAGSDLIDDMDRAQSIASHSVFGRVLPEQKVEIVTVLQSQGRHVAMVGDGINDVPSIKRADLGIAMGAGAAAARTVAGLVLENNDFALLPQTLAEGRTIQRNLRRSAKLFLLKNVYTLVLVSLGFAVFGLEFPYLPQQVTLLNALTIGIPALIIVLSRDRSNRAVSTGFLQEVGRYVLAAGVLIGIVALAHWLACRHLLDTDASFRRTLLLTTLIVMGLGNLVIVTQGEWRFVAWAMAAIAGFAVVMFVKPTAYFFDLSPLTGLQWLMTVPIAAIAIIPMALLTRRISASR